MPFAVIQPPENDDMLAETGKMLIEAAKNLGIDLDPEGFLFAWLSGCRVIVERDASNAIISMALVTVGKRWTHNDTTATVLRLEGNRTELLEFIRHIASALGARELFVQAPFPLEKDDRTEYMVTGYRLT